MLNFSLHLNGLKEKFDVLNNFSQKVNFQIHKIYPNLALLLKIEK